MIAPGSRIGKYEIVRLLGQGGFGMVFVGHDTALDRACALKFLLPEHTSRPEILQRFLKEARSAAKIRHGGIVTVYECGVVEGTGGVVDGMAFIAMELLEGQSLHERLARGAMAIDHAVEITRQVASALGAAHAAGIVHRDLKPDNIFLVPDPATALGERVKVLDFGIAKLADDAGGSAHKTSTHMIFGTPKYMSPEQCKSTAKVDERSDIYALGCILYEMVCGRAPFDGDAGELIGMHQFKEAAPAHSLRPDLPPRLAATITAMLAKSPVDRPQTMTELGQRLGGRPSGVVAAAASQSMPVAASSGITPMPILPASAPPPGALEVPPMLPRGEVGAVGSIITESSSVRRRSKWPLIAAGGIVVTGGAIALVVAMQGGGDTKLFSKDIVAGLELRSTSLQLTDGFDPNKIETVEIDWNGRKTAAVRSTGGAAGDEKQVKTWAEAATKKPNQSLATFINNINNLRPTEYKTEMSLDGVAPIVTLTYREANGSLLGTLALYKVDKVGVLPEGQELDLSNPPKGETEYYVLTERTRVPALVRKDPAQRSENDLPIVFGDKPPPTGNPFKNVPSPHGGTPAPMSVAVPSDVAAPPANAPKTSAGVSYKKLASGAGAPKPKPKPKPTDKVRVHYTGWTTDGRQFDSSVTHGMPVEFLLMDGRKDWIGDWTDGFQMMSVGDKTRFWIPAELAYAHYDSQFHDWVEAPTPLASSALSHSRAGMLVFDIELLAIVGPQMKLASAPRVKRSVHLLVLTRFCGHLPSLSRDDGGVHEEVVQAAPQAPGIHA